MRYTVMFGVAVSLGLGPLYGRGRVQVVLRLSGRYDRTGKRAALSIVLRSRSRRTTSLVLDPHSVQFLYFLVFTLLLYWLDRRSSDFPRTDRSFLAIHPQIRTFLEFKIHPPSDTSDTRTTSTSPIHQRLPTTEFRHVRRSRSQLLEAR